MGDTYLLSDIEFLRLVPPLSPAEYSALEKSIVCNGCQTPISVWDSLIVDGFHEYTICTKNHIPFSVKKLNFTSRDAAISWIAKNQIPKSNPKSDLRRYQIGKRYNAERSMNAHAPRKRMPSGETSEQSRQGRAGHIAREYGISHFAIHTYKEIATAVDAIADKDPRFAERYLAGTLRVRQIDLITVADLPPHYVRSLMNGIIRQDKRFCRSEDILDALSDKDLDKENQSAKERRKASAMVGQPSVKDMPSFDPDSEVAGLSLTIPTWTSSIDRAFTKTDMTQVTEKARSKLKKELLSLHDSVELFLLAIEETIENE